MPVCMCTHQCGYKKMFRIWGYSESRATFTLIFNCPNSTFWRALTTGQSSLLIPAPSHELKRNIIYMETNRQRYISCGELKAKTSALMGRHLANKCFSPISQCDSELLKCESLYIERVPMF